MFSTQKTLTIVYCTLHNTPLLCDFFCRGFRCLFQINQFVEDYGLEFVGASWMRSENEPFVNYTHTTEGGDPDEYCAGDPDYPDCVDVFKPLVLF